MKSKLERGKGEEIKGAYQSESTIGEGFIDPWKALCPVRAATSMSIA